MPSILNLPFQRPFDFHWQVDGEIAKVENNITKLKKKQQDLEEAAKKPPPEHGELRTQGTRPKNQSVAQLIYAENRRKASEAHKMLSSLGPAIDLPLYHQPSDTAVYLRNRTQFLAFRPRLLKFLRRRQKEKETRHRYLMSTYNKWMNEWGKRVSDLEKANNASSVATGTTVTATTTVAITSGGSTSTAAPTASGTTVIFHSFPFISICLFGFVCVLARACVCVFLIPCFTLVVCASPPSLVAATVDQLVDMILSLFIFFSWPRSSLIRCLAVRRSASFTRRYSQSCESREKTGKDSAGSVRVSNQMLTSKKSWTGFKNKRYCHMGLVWLLPLVSGACVWSDSRFEIEMEI